MTFSLPSPSCLLKLPNAEDIEDELGHMTDKPMKNGRNYVYSVFVHNMMDVIFMFPSPEYLRTVPTIVIAHTFCASPDTRISYRECLLIQGYFCAV